MEITVRQIHTATAPIEELLRRAPEPLAEPPPGSGLRPVMGDFGLPLIGHTLEFLADPIHWGRRWVEQFGPVSWGGGFGTRFVAALGPEATEAVLVNRDKAFSNGQGWEFFIGPFFRRGVMLLDFEEHHHHRRIMQQAFTADRLRDYQNAMNPAIDRGIRLWQPGEGFHVLPALKQLTLDLATEVFVGDELGRRADRINRAFVDTVRAGTAFVRMPVPGGRWSHGLRGRRVLEAYFRRQLPAKRAGDGTDLFTVLCHAETDEGHRFSDEDVVNHMIFVLMAAHDTSTITMSTMWYYLAKHPEWQERCRAESQALGKPVVDYDDLDRLRSLDLVMKESLRLVAPVLGLARRAVKDTQILGQYVPAGTLVVVPLLVSQRLEPWWRDPDAFDPERFSPERREDKVHRYAWAPFGGGAHKCIGMYFASVQVKAIMHQVLLRYRWSVHPRYEMPLDTTTLPVPADGLPVRLARLR